MDGYHEALARAWCWAIEALSTLLQISNSTFVGLLDAAPVSYDKFSETTKELAALRCLESLSALVAEPGASSALDSRAGFDFSRSCREVLLEILSECVQQIQSSKQQMDRAKLFKWDIYPFIEHKRAITFKYHLDQVRESILEGTHPHSDHLKERSGLLPNDNNFSSSKSRADSADYHHVRHHETSKNEGSLHLPHKPIASDTTIVDMVDGGGAGLASVSDGYDIEKDHLEVIKFLQSHCKVDQDFSAEQNLCMKCNEGGELLACKTTTCPLMMHESCVGGFVQLDTEGKFFCPLCVYCSAFSEYLESEKEAYLARKEFAIIMGKCIQN